MYMYIYYVTYMDAWYVIHVDDDESFESYFGVSIYGT